MITRWHRQRGERVWYLTGTDEHGQKVMRAAEEHGYTPQGWTDHLVETAWKPVLDTIDVVNDQFIRTTDDDHIERVQTFWSRVHDSGDVYEGKYEGLYCVSCEEFKLPGDLEVIDGVEVCSIHKTPPEHISETNYFFAMSAYADRLLELSSNTSNCSTATPGHRYVLLLRQSRCVDRPAGIHSRAGQGRQVPLLSRHHP